METTQPQLQMSQEQFAQMMQTMKPKKQMTSLEQFVLFFIGIPLIAFLLMVIIGAMQ